MTCTRHYSGCSVYLYGITLFLFCLLNRWPSSVYAAEPSSATAGGPSGASPVCAQASGSEAGTNIRARGKSSGEEGVPPAEASTSQQQEDEMLQGASGSTKAVQTGRSSFRKSKKSLEEEEAGATDQYGSESPPRWCDGRVVPVLDVSRLTLPEPKFSEVIERGCQDWMTPEDEKGLKAVLRVARRMKSRVTAGVSPFTGGSIFHRVLPLGSEFSVEFYDMEGAAPFSPSVFKRGYVIADGSWGVVAAVRRLPGSVVASETEEAESVAGSAEPGSAMKGASDAAPQASAASAQTPAGTRSRSRLQRFMKSLRGVRKSLRGIQERWRRSFRRSPRSAESPDKHTTHGSLASASAQAQESHPSSLVPSHSASSPQLRTRGPEAEASKAPAKTSSSTASTEASTSSAAARGSRSSDDEFARNTQFMQDLASDLVKGLNLENIFVIKVALISDRNFPVDWGQCLDAAEDIIAERIERTQQVLRCVPRGLTADQLYNFGFVLPIASGYIPGMDAYLGGSRFSPLHLFNYVQLLRPQLSDIYSIQVADINGVRYMVKRLLQLAAHLSAAGLVHMDIKRENIGVSPTGELMLLDFDYVVYEGTEFPCNMKPTIESAAPEIARRTMRAFRTGRAEKCTADRSVDAWDLGITIFEIVCSSRTYFACYSPVAPPEQRLDCIASLVPPAIPPRNNKLSSTRAPVHWGSCNPPKDIQEIIYSLLDLKPERRLDALKVFVFSDLFRSPAKGSHKAAGAEAT